MNLAEEARTLLDASGFRTALGKTSPNAVYFESEIIIGAVFIHSTLSDLIVRWEELQDRFLGSHSGELRTDPVKAWNIYTVHLTPDRGLPSQRTDAFDIEQNFRGTRKLVRAGVLNRTDLRDALLSLLPLQHRTTLSRNNLPDRLKERLVLSSRVLARLVESPDSPMIEHDLLEEP